MTDTPATSPPPNPLERRLISLCTQWEAFRDQHYKRLLIWNVSSRAVRLVEAFFEAQKRESACATRDPEALAEIGPVALAKMSPPGR